MSVKTNYRIVKERTRILMIHMLSTMCRQQDALHMIHSMVLELVEPAGIEPATFWLQTRRSPS
jgi:hypothetical protein